MKIISGPRVDLISPFPANEIKRLFGWMYCYRTIIDTDLSPTTEEEFTKHFKAQLPNSKTYGVIDKGNLTNQSHPAPLVGLLSFEEATPFNCYIHLASSRKAWRHHLMDEAAGLAIADVFNSDPQLLRISGMILAENKPVRYMAQRLGWKKEALLEDWVTKGGIEKSILHYGFTRRAWAAGA